MYTKKLQITPLDNPHKTVQIEKLMIIGRDHQNSIYLSDLTICPRHARIEERENGDIMLTDLRSKSGTYVNGARILQCILQEGDRIQIGDQLLVISNPSEVKKKSRSQNRKWSNTLNTLPFVSKSELPITLLGESGTGKDVLAKKIHQLSDRSGQPFIAVNCSALNDSLIESELFGHKKGSFTDAINDRKGAFEMARGGTLFLDEIGDLPVTLQPKLLRALENQEISPLGSDLIIRTNVRIIVATHQNLRLRVCEGKFRQDLFFRINVISLKVPALRDRMEDFETFLYQFAKECRVRFSHQAIERLKLHPWPGNIRELKNFVSKTSVIIPKKLITPQHVDQLLDPPLPNVIETPGYNLLRPNPSATKDIEKELIFQALLANRGNQRRTARCLNIPKSTLHDRIKTYGIDLTSVKPNNEENPGPAAS